MAADYIVSTVAARQLGVSRCTLLRAVHRGELRAAHRTPGGQFRFHPDDLDAYARRLRSPGAAAGGGQAGADRTASFTRLAALPDDLPPERLTEDVLSLLADGLDVGAVALARLEDGAVRVERWLDRAGMGLCAGLDLGGDAYGASLLAPGRPVAVEDVHADPRFAVLPATHLLGLGAYAGVPLRHDDGRPYGILCALHPEPWAPGEGRLALLALAGRALMHALDRVGGRAREDRLAREAAARAADFAAVLDRLPCGVVVVDAAGRVTFMNESGRRLDGRAVDLGRPLAAQAEAFAIRPLHAGDAALAPDETPIARALAGEEVPPRRGAVRLPGGAEDRVLETAAAPLRDAAGAVRGAVSIFADVTERVRAEEALRASEARFRSLYEQVPIGVMLVDPRGRAIMANAAAQRMLGYDEDELRRMSFADASLPEDAARSWALFREVLAGGRDGYSLEKPYLRKDGRLVWCRLTVSVARDRDGDPQGLIASLLDVTEQREARERLRRSEEQYRRIVETAQEGIWQIGADDKTIFVNQKMADMLGYSVEEMRGRSPFAFVAAGHAALATAGLARRRRGATGRGDVAYRRKDGSLLWAHLSANPLFDADGRYAGALAMLTDITERRRAEEEVRVSEQRFRALSEHATDLISVFDAEATIRYASPSYRAVLGYAPEEVMGRRAFTIIHPDDVPRVRAALARVAAVAGRTGTAEFRMRRRDGAWRTVEAIAVNRLGDPAVRGIIATTRDITARAQAEAALRHQATHDPLTDLPNRALLEERLERALKEARRTGGTRGLLVLDLDRFMEINNTFGRQQGDALLRQVAERLRAALPADGLMARLGGDEFAVLLPDAAQAVTAARALAAALDAPLQLDGQALHLGASAGVALYPEHGTDARTLLRHADVAMYAAKQDRGGYALYDPGRDHHSPERLALVRDLREAIAAGGLALHFQPQVEVGSRQVRGVEALARWPHPVRGTIPPDQFIPLAEQTGLIRPLTAWVLGEAVRQCAAWRQAGRPLTVSVNLAVWDLHDPALHERIARLLREHAVPAAALRLELTEGTLMADPERAAAMLRRLRGLGVGLSVDDFGSGYSSLAYLKRLPMDELKIDKGFVRQLATDAADAAIVASTVGLGHALGLRVVAEGIEDQAGWERLAALGCDVGQGYYLARPLPAEDLTRWLHESPWSAPREQGTQRPEPAAASPLPD